MSKCRKCWCVPWGENGQLPVVFYEKGTYIQVSIFNCSECHIVVRGGRILMSVVSETVNVAIIVSTVNEGKLVSVVDDASAVECKRCCE